MRFTLPLIVLLPLFINLSGCAQHGAVERARQTSNAAAVVTMNGFSYDPKHLTIHSGQTVEWVNTDAVVTHTVTADPKLAKTRGSVQLPPGADTFNSGDLKPGAHFRHTFTVPGTYRYFCIPHERMGMVGQIEVQK